VTTIISKNKQINKFLQGERNLVLPFDLAFKESSAEDGDNFHCVEVLRLLPAKRLVLKASKDDQNVVIKIFVAAQKGEHEYKKELRGHSFATASGVNVPRLISSHANPSEDYGLVYEFLDDAKSFGDEEIRNKKENITKLFKMMVKLHEYGIYQHDIHLDNILFKDNTLFLIDFGSVLCKNEDKPLSKRVSLKNLAKLVAEFPPLEQGQLIQLLSFYYQLRQWEWNNEELSLFVKILKSAWQKRRRDFLKKCFRNCTMTIYGRDFSREYAFRREFLQNIPIDKFNNIDQIMSEGEILKSGNSVTVVRVTIDGIEIVIKRYNIKSVWHFLRRCLRASRAAISWKNANLLEFISLPALKPLGFIERRVGWFRHTAYFMSEYQDAEELLGVYQRREPTDSELDQINNIFLSLQSCQISHGDFKAQNLLINAQGKISLIDLDSMKQHKSDKAFQRAFDKDKNRFIRNWQDTKIKQIFTELIC